jgi:hypothetical protein
VEQLLEDDNKPPESSDLLAGPQCGSVRFRPAAFPHLTDLCFIIRSGW